WLAYDGRFSYSRVTDQRGLQLHRAQPVPTDVHHVIDTAEYPEVAIGVTPGCVAGEVATWHPFPIILLVALRIAPQRAQHAWPRLADNQEAFSIRRDRRAAQVHHVGEDARHRQRG